MEKFKRIMFFISFGAALFISGYKISSDIREAKWHNAGHPPTFNGETMEKNGNYFISNSDNNKFSAYVSVDFIEANKICKICEGTNKKTDFCENDCGITVN